MRGNLRVLILSSPERPLKALERSLASLGFDLLVRTALPQARRALQEAPGIDVALTDTILPGGTWLDALVTVETSAPGTPVVVCTAEHSPELRDQVRDGGAYYAEMEPYYPRAVQLLIHAAWARKGHHRRRPDPPWAVLPPGDRAA
jgi:DNA-binding NtrC family response regulator